uniref:Putative transporter n=1 Tax=Ixodes ricinus TaxID=34613 RepID=A0A0K8RM97_IXORI
MSSAATCYSCAPGDTKDGMKARQADRMAGCGDCLPASVNRSLLPLKLHFFLYLAAQACVYAYLAVIGRQNGISAANIAVIFGFTPLAAVLFKPVCGYIIDRTQNATGVILALQFFLNTCPNDRRYLLTRPPTPTYVPKIVRTYQGGTT